MNEEHEAFLKIFAFYSGETEDLDKCAMQERKQKATLNLYSNESFLRVELHVLITIIRQFL